MSTKKNTVILFALLSLCLTGCSSILERNPFMGSYTFDKTYSYDHRYYALQSVEDRALIVTIYTMGTDEKIDEFSPSRSLDSWGICWEKDTYNIWTQSADIGTYCYEYQNGKWIRNENAREPDYIISRYDRIYRNNAELQKGIYKSPTE